MHCNICNRIWGYNQIHCPGCAARTLHHIPGSSDDSYTDSDISDHGPRTFHHRPGRHNPERDVLPTESSWETQGLESGAAEESWTTTAADTASVTAFIETAQASSTQATEGPAAGMSSPKKHPRARHMATHCCCGKPGVIWVTHCCCGNPSTHENSSSTLYSQRRILRVWPMTPAAIFHGPVPGKPLCRCSRCGNHHVSGRSWEPRYVKIVGNENQGCESGDEGNKKERSWWMTLLRWFCCC